MFQLNVIAVGLIPISNLEVFVEKVFISLHEFGIAVRKGLDKLSNRLDRDVVRVRFVSKSFNKGVEMVLIEPNF